MSKKRILVVEDDRNISKLLKYNLEKSGYDCILSKTGEEALKILEKEDVDLIILDIMLPKMDGFEVARELKKEDMYSDIPIIMLTAKGEEIDRVLGLELGADDYITKPFSPRELILRIKGILKRKEPKESASKHLRSGELKVDIDKYQVKVGKKEVRLTAMEFKLLTTLMQRKGRVQSREHLLDYVWDISAEVTTRTIDTHIKCLRKKLGRSGRLIETVRGMGYRFREEV